MSAKTPLRPKHVPMRTCLGCGTVAPKASLIRVVRSPGGDVVADPSGKKPGRGAYLCPDRSCWQQAVSKRRLEKSLQVRLSAADLDGLLSYAQSLSLGTEKVR